MNLVGRTVLTPLTRWAEESQRTACRNAMVASTALASRRQETDETQEFVRATLARRSGRGLESGTLRVPLVAHLRG
ncbi:MAG: hypothetical protein JWR42_1045 [Marmoricola sp.]|nr:hypothetical protein [Marmoricola sp.]